MARKRINMMDDNLVSTQPWELDYLIRVTKNATGEKLGRKDIRKIITEQGNSRVKIETYLRNKDEIKTFLAKK